MLPRWTVSLEGCPRRVNHSAALVGHRIFMFGGYCVGDDYQERKPIDVHVFNIYSYRWTKVPSNITFTGRVQDVPYMRYGHASVAIGDKVYLWGGRNDLAGACNKLYCFNTVKLKWRLKLVKGEYPGARDGHAMCVVRGNIYVFGGYEEETDCFSNEMFMIDMSNNTWHQIRPQAGSPASYRDFHTITPCGDLIYVFGGRSDLMAPYHSNREVYDNVLKVFNTRSRVWKSVVNPSSPRPPGRRSHSAFMYDDCLYVICGYNSEIDQHFNCLWKFDPDTRMWSEVHAAGTAPMPRRRQYCCLHKDRLFLFGGTSPTSQSSQPYSPIDSLDGNTDHRPLFDHNDTHVLDFRPSLKTLCIEAVLKHDLDLLTLPSNVRWEIRMMTTPNSISRPLSQG